jgi:hypothetical protein
MITPKGPVIGESNALRVNVAYVRAGNEFKLLLPVATI